MSEERKEPAFEEALKELEEIVDELESGNLTLDAALKAFSKGIELSRICSGQLEGAELQIDLLLKQKDGTMGLKALELEEFIGEK